MSKCEHKFKKRVYGPFSADGIAYKIVCSDCLDLIETVAGSAAEKKPYAKPAPVTAENRLELNDLLTQVQGLELNDWDRKFIDDFSERAMKYDDVRISEKQQAVLDKIQGKYLANTTASAAPKPAPLPDFKHDSDDIPF